MTLLSSLIIQYLYRDEQVRCYYFKKSLKLCVFHIIKKHNTSKAEIRTFLLFVVKIKLSYFLLSNKLDQNTQVLSALVYLFTIIKEPF